MLARADITKDRHMLIDAHSHLDKNEQDLESVLEEINQYRIATINNAMDRRWTVVSPI